MQRHGVLNIMLTSYTLSFHLTNLNLQNASILVGLAEETEYVAEQ